MAEQKAPTIFLLIAFATCNMLAEASVWVSQEKLTCSQSPCRIHNKVIDCSHLKLTQVPSFSEVEAKNAEELDLGHNMLTKIPVDAFKNFFNLLKLDLRYNSISRKSMEKELFVDLGRLRDLRLGHNAINKFPYDLFQYTPHVETLDLSYMNNGLKTIPADVFTYLPKLKELFMDKNGICSAKITARNIPKLERLHLTRNHITNISSGDFSFLKGAALILLDLSWNSLDYVQTDIFFPLKSMKFLNLTHSVHDLDTFLPMLGKALENISISVLNLMQNGFQVLDSQTFMGWHSSSVVEIDLSLNDISSVKESPFASFPSLRKLNLYKNKLRVLGSSAFTGTPNLQVLDLSNNSLTEINNLTFESLAQSNLTNLYLEQNQIAEIAPEGAFNDLSHMRFLKLSHNLLKQTLVGSEFAGMPNLEVLDLGLNKQILLQSTAFKNNLKLQKLYLNVDYMNIIPSPSPFRNLTDLHTLDLSNNTLVRFGSDVFNDLSNLEVLYLQHNNLMQVWQNIEPPINYLHGLKSLSTLDLAFNGIVNIPLDTFKDQTKLETLYLSHNKISSLPNGLFSSLVNLVKLELHSNSITVLNKTNLDDILNSLQVLSISNNPFSCTCDLQWFRDWLNSTSTEILDFDDITCFSPPMMADKTVVSYIPSYLCDHILPLYAVYLISGCAALILFLFVLLYCCWSHMHYMYLRAKTRRHRIRRSQLVQSRAREYERLDGTDTEFMFDAFISYSSKDQQFVDNILKPQLQHNKDPTKNMHLCFHNEQFIPGNSVLENIQENMEKSKKIICLLSRNFLASSWCKHEKDLALYEQLFGGNNILIVICLEKIPTKELSKYDRVYKMMKKETYLEWSEDISGISEKLFWERLRVAVNQDVQEKDSCCCMLCYCCCCFGCAIPNNFSPPTIDKDSPSTSADPRV